MLEVAKTQYRFKTPSMIISDNNIAFDEVNFIGGFDESRISKVGKR
jgi:hypothetical protein